MSYELQIRKKDGTLHSKHLIAEPDFLASLTIAREIFHRKVTSNSGLTLRFDAVKTSKTASSEDATVFQPGLFTEAQ